MFINTWHLLDVDEFERCVEATGDLEKCRATQRVLQLVEDLGLVGCVARRGTEECLRECLRRCGGEDCAKLCLVAMDMAAGVVVAKNIAERAKAAALLGISPLDVAAMLFNMELNRMGRRDCPERANAARALSMAAVELRHLLGSQELLLLLAPTISMAYSCVGDDALDFLEAIAPAVGEEMMARIAVALEEGTVKIGNIVAKFPPVKTT
jgi:hypothetical protein